MEETSSLEEARLAKIKDLKEAGINLFSNSFKVSHSILEIRKGLESNLEFFTNENTRLKIAGRVMAVNKFGKSSFIRIKDRTDYFQIYLTNKELGDEKYELFKKLDIGDFLGFEGYVFQTKTKEWTLLAKSFELITKSLKSLPEKFHGLKDPEKRYRKRYLDLIMNDEIRNIFIKRSKIVQAIRSFFLEREFLELETPMMQTIAGGAEANPFITHHNALNMELYLRIAPELYLKRLVVGGFERVFEINRNFRNEGISTKHNPEFTMLEFYQSYSSYEDLMKLTEELFSKLLQELNGSLKIEYQGDEIDFSKWTKIKLLDSIVEIGGVEKEILLNAEKLYNFAESKKIIEKRISYGKTLTKVFEELVEPKLIQPTFVYSYPIEVSPLSRKNDLDKSIADRFELFIAGKEIANGFSELNDPDDQKERFLAQVKEKEAGNTEAHLMDEDYVEALRYGMPPTAGEGIGIDRLTMLLTNSASIREVILFPLLKNK